MHDIKHILVVSRSTADCKKALHFGVSLAGTLKTKLTILHVEYEPLVHWGVAGVARLIEFENDYLAMMKRVKKEIAEMIRQENTTGIDITEIIEDGEPVSAIAELVAKEKVDLLIMAAHEETRIEHVIYGWTNHEIIRKLPCSVVLVKGD